ncbi:MAG TPA: heme-binding protein [Desulfobacterales bacterium]|nr:heme-binding protein [Desulfobacterales bacterium]
MNAKAKGLLLVTVGIIAIQFIPIDRTNPAVTADLQAPDDIKTMLTTSCYDCHSNQTVWPWYSYVAPISLQLNSHIKQGRERLNFSTWGEYTVKEQKELASSVVREVSVGNMPKFPYTLAHPAARFNEEQQTRLTNWFKEAFAVSEKEVEGHDHNAH